MKKHILHHIKIATMGLLILFSQEGFSSENMGGEEEFLEIGTARVPMGNFVETLFSEAFDGKRLLVLASLRKQEKSDAVYKSSPFQTALKEMGEGKRNAFVCSLPFEDKSVIKPLMHWSLLGSLGKAELSKANESAIALQELEIDDIEGMLSTLDNPELRSLFGNLLSLEDTPPAHDAPFLERYFYEQKGQVEEISEELAQQSSLLKETEKKSDTFYDLVGTLNFLGKRLYAATNPTDHGLKKCPDELLFGFSHEIAHLELSYYFLKNSANREDQAIDALAVQLGTAEDDLARQNRLKILLNTTMLKREILASAAIALSKFLAPEKKDDQSLLDAYMALGNFFHKYIEATTDPYKSSGELSVLHEELCGLTLSFSVTPSDLLEMDLPSKEVDEEDSDSEGVIEVVSIVRAPSSGVSYEKTYQDLRKAAHDLGGEAISQNSVLQAQRAGLVEHAAHIAKAAKEASDKGDLELANRLIDRLVQIKKELSEL